MTTWILDDDKMRPSFIEQMKRNNPQRGFHRRPLSPEGKLARAQDAAWNKKPVCSKHFIPMCECVS